MCTRMYQYKPCPNKEFFLPIGIKTTFVSSILLIKPNTYSLVLQILMQFHSKLRYKTQDLIFFLFWMVEFEKRDQVHLTKLAPWYVRTLWIYCVPKNTSINHVQFRTFLPWSMKQYLIKHCLTYNHVVLKTFWCVLGSRLSYIILYESYW